MYLVTYDVSDDRARDRVAAALSGYGTRVQKSVFECEIDAQQVDELTDRLVQLLTEPTVDSVRVYRLCRSCHERSFALDNDEILPGSENAILA